MFFATIEFFYYLFLVCWELISLLNYVAHAVLPMGLDVGLLAATTYLVTKLRKPKEENVKSIFGPDPWSAESKEELNKVVRCIAHRGAGLDAPENTLQAFQYCVNNACNFVELDVRISKDGQLVLLHDQGLERLADSSITDVRVMDWDMIKNIDIGSTHPNKSQFKEVRLCLLDDALKYLLEKEVRMIIDVKGDNREIVDGILKTFKNRPQLYKCACVTCFNPFILYQIRREDPDIVGCLSYRPYCFSAHDYDAETGPNTPRYGDNLPVHAVLRAADSAHSLLWRLSARWCNVSAVLLHKDIVSPAEIQYWRARKIRCCGWCVNRPLEKLYWRGVLKAPYLANTLLGEPDMAASQEKKDEEPSFDDPSLLINKIHEPERQMSSGQK